MTKVDHVAARFGGRDLTFRIHREDLPAFESYVGASAFAIYRAIASGEWTVQKIKDVLRFALLGESARSRLREMAKVATVRPFVSLEKSSFIDDVFVKNPPAQYAVLAANVIAAALFGIDEEDATFTDEEVVSGAA